MKRLIYILVILLLPYNIYAQTVKELQKQRNKTLEQLETTNKMLNETKQNETSTANKVALLNKSIQERQQLISNINTEISALNNEMTLLGTQRDSLIRVLELIKADYAMLVVKAHEAQHSNSALRFLLSSDSFRQLMRRARYLQEFSEYRKVQAARIVMLTDSISSKNDLLEQDRNQKEDAIKTQQQEKERLSRDQHKQQQMLKQLKQKEKDLLAQQKKQQKKADDLNARINKLIEEEIKRQEAKKKKQGQSAGGLTKEEQLIAGGFEQNKGRLPWPTEKGFISGYYGVQPHPVLSHVTIDNKGIYIQTTQGSNARAVYEGVVTQCFTVPGSNNIVIVQHGNYRTVYANLTTLYVKVGDKVKTKQNLGKIYTDPDNDNKTEMQFQIYKDKTRLNPQPWLAK